MYQTFCLDLKLLPHDRGVRNLPLSYPAIVWLSSCVLLLTNDCHTQWCIFVSLIRYRLKHIYVKLRFWREISWKVFFLNIRGVINECYFSKQPNAFLIHSLKVDSNLKALNAICRRSGELRQFRWVVCYKEAFLRWRVYLFA